MPTGQSRLCRPALSVFGIVVALAVWEISVSFVGNPGLFPPLRLIWRAFGVWTSSGLFFADVLDSLPRALLAIVIATPVGVAVGVGLTISRVARDLFEPSVHFLRALPPVALLPLFVLWLGIDWGAKLSAAVFVAIFPVAVTTMQAARFANRTYSELARDLQLSYWTYVLKIIIPASLPAIVPGVRLAAGTSFIMLYVSEIAGASVGLGYRISVAQLAYSADLMIASLLTLGLIALATDSIINEISARVLHYAGR